MHPLKVDIAGDMLHILLSSSHVSDWKHLLQAVLKLKACVQIK